MNTAGLRSREARPMARTDAESARSRDVRGSSPVERSDSGEVPSAARRRGRTTSAGELRAQRGVGVVQTRKVTFARSEAEGPYDLCRRTSRGKLRRLS
jgi:hypothetical protein